MGQSCLSQEEIYHVCKFQETGTCIKEHVSRRSRLLLFVNCFFWLTEQTSWQEVYWGRAASRVGYFFCQLRLPSCLETGLHAQSGKCIKYHLSHFLIQWKLYNRYMVHSISFQTFFVQAFKIAIDPWKFSMLLLYILWDDWPIFMISGSKEQLQQELEYTLLKPDCHSWWISKMQSGHEEEQYAINIVF